MNLLLLSSPKVSSFVLVIFDNKIIIVIIMIHIHDASWRFSKFVKIATCESSIAYKHLWDAI